MNVDGKHYRSVWMENSVVYMINQNMLPFEFKIIACNNYKETCYAISDMTTRGAGAIGVAAGFAMAQAFLEFENTKPTNTFNHCIKQAKSEIENTRPTARNLFYATEMVYKAGIISINNAVETAQQLANANIEEALKIGEYGNNLISNNMQILTHCNAGWLAFADYGSALSPIYTAKNNGKNPFVYVDETRPRSQGARLTAWELFNEGVNHTIIPDNAGAYLMSKGMVDMVIVGADRISANGDTANKIGTFEKAIVAKEFGIPFYIAAPLSTFDISLQHGSLINIEMRHEDELLYAQGIDANNQQHYIRLASPGSHALNPAFDVTPAQYIKGIITEKGIIKPQKTDILKLFNK